MLLPGPKRSLTISLAVWNLDTIHERDEQTDQTDTGRQQKSRLRIASRDKNNKKRLLIQLFTNV